MRNPDERPGETAHQGASDGEPGKNETRNPSRNGQRKPRRPAVAEAGDAHDAAGSGRPQAEQKDSGNRRKRARRRKRGKAAHPQEATAEAAAQVRPSGKISNRRRRARNRKQQARQQNDATLRAAETGGKLTADDLKRAFFDDFAAPFCVCRAPMAKEGGNLSATVAMILCEPAKGIMEVAPLPAINREFTRYDLTMEEGALARAAGACPDRTEEESRWSASS